jgi:hypothetical protein
MPQGISFDKYESGVSSMLVLTASFLVNLTKYREINREDLSRQGHGTRSSHPVTVIRQCYPTTYVIWAGIA